MSELLAVTLPYIYFNAQLCTALRLVYTCYFLCNFCRTSLWNFFRALARYKNSKCKPIAISLRFIATLSNMFETWCNLVEIAGNFALQSQRNRLVYTCDKSCIGERDQKSHVWMVLYTCLPNYLLILSKIHTNRFKTTLLQLWFTRNQVTRFEILSPCSYFIYFRFCSFPLHVNIDHFFHCIFNAFFPLTYVCKCAKICPFFNSCNCNGHTSAY